MTLIDWQYCNDPNDINEAIKTKDENWEGLTSADDIISITYDTNHGCYVVFWRAGTVLPDNFTNGDMIKAMFPEIESIDAPLLKVYVMVYIKDHKCMRFDADWWDAPYEGNTNEDANRD